MLNEIEITVICVVIGACFVGAVFAGMQVLTLSACLRLGYPSANVSITGDRYCIVRVDQTDIVVPLAEAKPR